jgi:hypothetical protein
MVKRPTGFGGYKPPRQPKPPPAPRNYGFERQLCEAIAKRVVVALRYGDDFQERTFAPYAVFESDPNDVCVSGFQLHNPAKPLDRNEPRNLTVGKIASLRLTDEAFAYDQRFNSGDAKYRNGVICIIR